MCQSSCLWWLQIARANCFGKDTNLIYDDGSLDRDLSVFLTLRHPFQPSTLMPLAFPAMCGDGFCRPMTACLPAPCGVARKACKSDSRLEKKTREKGWQNFHHLDKTLSDNCQLPPLELTGYNVEKKKTSLQDFDHFLVVLSWVS